MTMASHINIQGNSAQSGSFQINNVNLPHPVYITEEIDRICFRELRCPPDSDIVKNRLKENKGKLFPQLIEWVLQDSQYKSWKDGDDICLLWIKGGAGKGKTMMSIGLIEKLLHAETDSMSVTYFFCQHGNYELNTTQAIIKGLIRQLTNQQISLKMFLRNHWDHGNNRFDMDFTSLRTLWDIFLRMLNECKCQRVYIIVDALDECQDDGMPKFLKLIVRNGLDRPAKIKWLLTSRPLDSADRLLLAGRDQVQVSLELNSEHVSKAVSIYIAEKVEELARHATYGKTLKQSVKDELVQKSEGTFLWASLVCEKLESVDRDEALATIQHLPGGLDNLYDRIFKELNDGNQGVAKNCMRLVKVMMLAYRPLKVEEVGSAIDLVDEEGTIKMLLDRCASIIKIQERRIDFVHQSVRDYLKRDSGQFILDKHEQYRHDEIATKCLSRLSEQLKANLVELPRPDSTIETLKRLKDEKRDALLASVDYAATFWAQHFKDTRKTSLVNSGLTGCAVSAFLHTKFLEWLECLSLLDRLPQAIEALRALTDVGKENFSIFVFVQDAKRFLLRHYHTIANWPLQIYSSAIIFSPESSVVRENSKHKAPKWLLKLPCIEETWTNLIQTLKGHLGPIGTIVFSPDGKQIASGSEDKTIKIWDAANGSLQRTLIGHSSSVKKVLFSSDGEQIVSFSQKQGVRLWNAATGDLQGALHWSERLRIEYPGLSNATTDNFQFRRVRWRMAFQTNNPRLWKAILSDFPQVFTINFKRLTAARPTGNVAASSSDLKQLATGLSNGTINLSGAPGGFQKILKDYSSQTKISALTFSPDGKQIVSGSLDGIIKIWDPDTATRDFQSHPEDYSIWCHGSVAFSPDGMQVASSSLDGTIKLWDTATGNFQKNLTDYSSWTKINAVAFSPDSKQVASSSLDGTIKLWDVATGNLQKTLADNPSRPATGDLQKILTAHSSWTRINAVAFSPDGKQVASGPWDRTIKLWDTVTEDLQRTLIGHSAWVNVVAFSSSGNHIASGSEDKTIRLWDIGKADCSQVESLSDTSREIKTSAPVYTIKFSFDDRYLATNVGPILLEDTHTERQPTRLVPLQDLYIGDQWIYYGLLPLIRLPPDLPTKAYDSQGDKIAIVLKNGWNLAFVIDRRVLRSTMGCHAS